MRRKVTAPQFVNGGAAVPSAGGPAQGDGAAALVNVVAHQKSSVATNVCDGLARSYNRPVLPDNSGNPSQKGQRGLAEAKERPR